jgi:hypothetical protein
VTRERSERLHARAVVPLRMAAVHGSWGCGTTTVGAADAKATNLA